MLCALEEGFKICFATEQAGAKVNILYILGLLKGVANCFAVNRFSKAGNTPVRAMGGYVQKFISTRNLLRVKLLDPVEKGLLVGKLLMEGL